MSIEKVEAKVGYSMKKALKEENVYMDHESQIKAIEKTFSDAKKPIFEHSSKKGVTAVEVLPVLPDFKVRSLSLLIYPQICVELTVSFLQNSCGSIRALRSFSTPIRHLLTDLPTFKLRRCHRL
jgi:hypothetical protein